MRAKGRAASARCWARRSFAADTIFMALVIWRVFFTLRMRRRISRMLAIYFCGLRLVGGGLGLVVCLETFVLSFV